MTIKSSQRIADLRNTTFVLAHFALALGLLVDAHSLFNDVLPNTYPYLPELAEVRSLDRIILYLIRSSSTIHPILAVSLILFTIAILLRFRTNNLKNYRRLFMILPVYAIIIGAVPVLTHEFYVKQLSQTTAVIISVSENSFRSATSYQEAADRYFISLASTLDTIAYENDDETKWEAYPRSREAPLSFREADIAFHTFKENTRFGTIIWINFYQDEPDIYRVQTTQFDQEFAEDDDGDAAAIHLPNFLSDETTLNKGTVDNLSERTASALYLQAATMHYKHGNLTAAWKLLVQALEGNGPGTLTAANGYGYLYLASHLLRWAEEQPRDAARVTVAALEQVRRELKAGAAIINHEGHPYSASARVYLLHIGMTLGDLRFVGHGLNLEWESIGAAPPCPPGTTLSPLDKADLIFQAELLLAIGDYLQDEYAGTVGVEERNRQVDQRRQQTAQSLSNCTIGTWSALLASRLYQDVTNATGTASGYAWDRTREALALEETSRIARSHLYRHCVSQTAACRYHLRINDPIELAEYWSPELSWDITFATDEWTFMGNHSYATERLAVQVLPEYGTTSEDYSLDARTECGDELTDQNGAARSLAITPVDVDSGLFSADLSGHIRRNYADNLIKINLGLGDDGYLEVHCILTINAYNNQHNDSLIRRRHLVGLPEIHIEISPSADTLPRPHATISVILPSSEGSAEIPLSTFRLAPENVDNLRSLPSTETDNDKLTVRTCTIPWKLEGLPIARPDAEIDLCWQSNAIGRGEWFPGASYATIPLNVQPGHDSGQHLIVVQLHYGGTRIAEEYLVRVLPTR